MFKVLAILIIVIMCLILCVLLSTLFTGTLAYVLGLEKSWTAAVKKAFKKW